MTINKRQLLAPAVYGYLFLSDGGLPRLTRALTEAICRSWSIDEEMVNSLHLAAIPTKIQNFFIAENCARHFGDLSKVEGFYKCRDLWWLDLDERLAGRGFLMPVTHSGFGWIERFVAFRDPRDRHPFTVKVRKELRAAA